MSSRSVRSTTSKPAITGQAGVTLFEYELPRDVPLLRAATFRDRSQPSAVIHGLLLISLATLEQAWREFFFTPEPAVTVAVLSLIHISEPTRLLSISYAVFC